MQLGVLKVAPLSSYHQPLRWDRHLGDRTPGRLFSGASSVVLLLSTHTPASQESYLEDPAVSCAASLFPARSPGAARPPSPGGEQRLRGARGRAGARLPGRRRRRRWRAPEPAFLRSGRSPRGDVTPGSAPVPPRAK